MVQGCACVCMHTDVKCPQFTNVYQKYCYLFLSWILKSIQFPADYWFKMWIQALTHVGLAPLLSHTIADRQKGYSGSSSLGKEELWFSFSLTFPFPLGYVPQQQTESGRGQKSHTARLSLNPAKHLSSPNLVQDQAEFPWISPAILTVSILTSFIINMKH